MLRSYTLSTSSLLASPKRNVPPFCLLRIPRSRECCSHAHRDPLAEPQLHHAPLLNGIDLLARLDVRTHVLSILDVLPLSTSAAPRISIKSATSAGLPHQRTAASKGRSIKSAQHHNPLPTTTTTLPAPARRAAAQRKNARDVSVSTLQCHRAAAGSKRLPLSPLPCRLSPCQRFTASSSTHETSHEHEIEPRIVVCAAVCRTQLRARTGALSHACAHGNHGTWRHTQKKTFSAGRQPSRF